MKLRESYKHADRLYTNISLKWPVYQRVRQQLSSIQKQNYAYFLKSFNQLDEENKKTLLDRYFKGVNIIPKQAHRNRETSILQSYVCKTNEFGHALDARTVRKTRMNHLKEFRELIGSDTDVHEIQDNFIKEEIAKFTEKFAEIQVLKNKVFYHTNTSSESLLNDVLKGFSNEINIPKTRENTRGLLKEYDRIFRLSQKKNRDFKIIELPAENHVKNNKFMIKAVKLMNNINRTMTIIDRKHVAILEHHFIRGGKYKNSKHIIGEISEPAYYDRLNKAMLEFARFYNDGELIEYIELEKINERGN